jgi:hypothetical protein
VYTDYFEVLFPAYAAYGIITSSGEENKKGARDMTKSTVASQRFALDKRQEERMSVRRPVRLNRGAGVTHNISASGVFFETNADFALGSKIIFAIELDGARGEKLELICRGEIVRVELRGSKACVAAKIVTSKLE